MVNFLKPCIAWLIWYNQRKFDLKSSATFYISDFDFTYDLNLPQMLYLNKDSVDDYNANYKGNNWMDRDKHSIFCFKKPDFAQTKEALVDLVTLL